ncbi:hypothetical protein [Castellaniella sp.]|uniref:hypothetical protein n=1 Tax=Castellaniella sp. TaxID=1955812 RepID=UPI003C789DF7
MRAAAHAQRGQVLVLGLVLATLLGLAWLRYFATAQVTASKARMVHGLDAASYSGALVQARTLNFLAYLNRARLGHQLAMAHVLTLGSWAHFGGMQAQRLAQGNPPAYLIGMLFGANHGRAYLAAAAAAGLNHQAQVGGSLASAFAAHESFIHDQSASLSDTLVAGLPEARLAIMRQVLAAHYPELGRQVLTPQIQADAWPGFLQKRPADASLATLLHGLAGLYGFLGPRNETARNVWAVDPRCPAWRHELRRRGQTQLDASGRWQAGDTQSFHAVRSNRWIGCYYREYAMGWAWMPAQSGQAIVGGHSTNAPTDFSQEDFWRWVQAATGWDIVGGQANPLANSYAMQSAVSWPSRGLAAYFDVRGDLPPQGQAGFVIRLTLPNQEGQSVHARSAAETFFTRPAVRQDGHSEAANLFHPYWHARLSSPLLPLPGD